MRRLCWPSIQMIFFAFPLWPGTQYSIDSVQYSSGNVDRPPLFYPRSSRNITCYDSSGIQDSSPTASSNRRYFNFLCFCSTHLSMHGYASPVNLSKIIYCSCHLLYSLFLITFRQIRHGPLTVGQIKQTTSPDAVIYTLLTLSAPQYAEITLFRFTMFPFRPESHIVGWILFPYD